ncbi:MAG: TerB family tellurite resistance protein [Pseudomonadota bacterium]
MLDQLLSLFRGESSDQPTAKHDRHQLAAAALLVTAAAMDDDFEAAERERIRILLETRFALSSAEADELLADAETWAEESVDLHGFTSAIKAGFEPHERVDVMEMVWEVVYTDGRLHDHEASLMRRLAGLLGVTDRESGSARLRVRRKLGLD